MTTPSIGKWIEATSPDDCVQDVARQTMQARLAAVQHYLPLAAEKADEDVEHVHQLRVFSRRADAALKLYADLLPEKRARWLAKQLRRIRHAANDARDYDVLGQLWAREHSEVQAESLLVHVQERRTSAQQFVIAIHEQMQGDQRLEDRIAKLLQRVRPRGKNKGKLKKTPFGEWARRQLRPLVQKFFQAAPGHREDVAALHQFRIRSKELRYALELLSGAFPPALRETLYPAIETLQDKLGQINDHATARVRLRERLDEVTDPAERRHLRQLFAKERTRFEQACHDFLAWWTQERQHALRAEFEAVLADQAPSRRQGRKQELQVSPSGGTLTEG